MQQKLKKLILQTDSQNVDLIKRKKLDLQIMVKQNKHSKEVIDKLKHRNNFVDKKQTQQFDKLEDQLKNLVIKINCQSKKNRVLKQLIQIMNLQLINNKKTEQIQNSQMRTTREKKVKKIQQQIKKQQYDIQQILQKHNEQIAKINVLKEQVSSSRRQRVVYSNLFKKIEKQIKIYEQKFKETLLYAHQIQNKKKIIFQQMNQKKKVLEKLTNRNQVTTVKNYSQQNNKRDQTLQFNDNHDNFFLTNVSKKKNQLSNQIKKSNKNSMVHQQLQTYKIFFDKLKAQTGYQNIEQITQKFQTLEQQNELMMCKANQINQLIQEKSQMLKKIKIQKNPRKICEQNQENNNTEKNYENLLKIQKLIGNEKEETERNLRKIQNICSILNVKIQQINNISMDNLDDYLRGIQARLTELKFLQRQIQNNHLNDNKRKFMDQNQFQIQQIIDKSDKYQESQKIFSKQMFEVQYNKQLNKFKKHKLKK